MHLNSSTDSLDGIVDKKSQFHDTYDSQNDGYTRDDIASEWILSSPFFATISDHILTISVLSMTSNVHMKARFVESFFFTFCLSCVVLHAAAPHFVNF